MAETLRFRDLARSRSLLKATPHTCLVIHLAALARGVGLAGIGIAGAHTLRERFAACARAVIVWRGGLRRRGRRGCSAGIAVPACCDGGRRRVHAGGRRHDQIKLPCFALLRIGDVQLWAIGIARRERAGASARVLDAVTRLTVSVHAEPFFPARLAMRRRSVDLQVEAIAVLEAHVPFVDRLNARAASTGSRTGRKRGKRYRCAARERRSQGPPRAFVLGRNRHDPCFPRPRRATQASTRGNATWRGFYRAM